MSKYDKLIKKVEVFEKLAVYGDRSNFLKALAQEVTPTVGGTPEAEAYLAQFPQNSSAPAPAKPQLPSIPLDVQEMLSKIVTVEGVGLPLQNDGQIGSKTKQALDAFRKKFNVPGNFSDQDTFGVVKNTYNRDPDRYGKLSSPGKAQPKAAPAPAPAPAQPQVRDLDDAYKAQQEYYKKQSLPPGVKG